MGPEEEEKLSIGIIGMSEGNGHPYSWSAIINGAYREDVMADCGFPGVPAYLAANRDTLGVDGAQVTHIWTQERGLSEHIACASMVEHVVDKLEDLIGQVDAVILARDDPEQHVTMARPFLDADVPIFIDKPLAATREDLAYFSRQYAAGKLLMSCSSMRYAAESRAVKQMLGLLGEIELAVAVGKKDWIKYGVHMLEGLFALVDDPKVTAVKHVGKSGKDVVYVQFETGLVATLHLFHDIVATFQISIFGRAGWRSIEYSNWYAMFRDNLVEFVRSVRQGNARLSFQKTENIIRALIAANESLAQGGQTVTMDGVSAAP